MKGCVKDNPVELCLKRLLQMPGIVFHSLRANINFAYNFPRRIGQIKTDHIGIVTMFQIFPINAQKKFITAKHIIELAQFLFFVFKQQQKKTPEFSPVSYVWKAFLEIEIK